MDSEFYGLTTHWIIFAKYFLLLEHYMYTVCSLTFNFCRSSWQWLLWSWSTDYILL